MYCEGWGGGTRLRKTENVRLEMAKQPNIRIKEVIYQYAVSL